MKEPCRLELVPQPGLKLTDKKIVFCFDAEREELKNLVEILRLYPAGEAFSLDLVDGTYIDPPVVVNG